VALEMFQVWWPMESFKLGNPWKENKKHPCLGVNGKTSLFGGPWKEKNKHHFHLLPLFTQKILLEHYSH
jgi:hypothetical protein